MPTKLKTASFCFDVNGKDINVNWELPDSNEYRHKVKIWYNGKYSTFKMDCSPSQAQSLWLLRHVIKKNKDVTTT